MLDAGAPLDPCLRHLQAQRCCAITSGFQPEAVVCLKSSRMMHFTLELEQFGIAAEAPFPTTFFDLNGKGFSTFFWCRVTVVWCWPMASPTAWHA